MNPTPYFRGFHAGLKHFSSTENHGFYDFRNKLKLKFVQKKIVKNFYVLM